MMGNVVEIGSPVASRNTVRFADFAREPVALDGSRMLIEAILEEEIQILAFKIQKSKFEDSKTGKYTIIQFKLHGEPHVAFTSSTILSRQCEQYKDYMPFLTRIKQISRYYTMT